MKLNKSGSKSTSYSIERGFISKLLETKDMKTIKDCQIEPYFLTGDNKRIFKFIQESFKTDGDLPTPRVINQKFPSYELEYHIVDNRETVGNDETLTYWCKELRTKAKHNRLAEITEEVAKLLDSGSTDNAFAEMKKGVWKIEDEIVETSSIDITKDVDERKLLYLERKKNKGMVGIPTGIPHLDYIIKGLIDETLTTVIANTGVGKTWLLVLFGAYAMLHNYKVCVFITEMSTQLMRDRFEAMLFGMIRGSFSYKDFKSGSLTKEAEDEYFSFLEEDLPNLEPLIIETATGVSSIVSVIEREKPDLILVDGAYLMEDEQGAKDDWLRVTHITRDLKKIAKNWHKPIVINTQADKNTSKKTGPELGSIMYTQSIGQDSDNVLALYRDEVMIADKEMGLRVLKQREGELGKVIINWDFDNMKFNSIYSEKDGGNKSEELEADEDYTPQSAVIGSDVI